MKQYPFHYGHGSKSFTLDENHVLNEIRMPETPVMENVAQGVLDAIYHPIGMSPINELIKPGQTVTFICNDPTRVANSFDFMPVLVNEMNKLARCSWISPTRRRSTWASCSHCSSTSIQPRPGTWRKAWAKKWPAGSKCLTVTPMCRKTLSILELQAALRRY